MGQFFLRREPNREAQSVRDARSGPAGRLGIHSYLGGWFRIASIEAWMDGGGHSDRGEAEGEFHPVLSLIRKGSLIPFHPMLWLICILCQELMEFFTVRSENLWRHQARPWCALPPARPLIARCLCLPCLFLFLSIRFRSLFRIRAFWGLWNIFDQN